MRPGARTPGGARNGARGRSRRPRRPALAELFGDGAVLVTGRPPREARGGEAIARIAAELWEPGATYVADPERVLQARDTALVLARHGISVMRRGRRRHVALRDRAPGRRRQPTGGSMTSDTTPRSRRRRPSPARARPSGGSARSPRSRRRPQDTGGQMTIIEMTEPPGSEAPWHVHHREDEAFWILEGDVTIQVGDQTIECHAGRLRVRPARHPAPLHRRPERLPDALHPHAGRLREAGTRDGRAGRRRARCRRGEFEPDFEHVARVAQANGCELLGD